MEPQNEKKPEDTERSFRRILYPKIPLRSANALVIGCCAVFILMIVLLTVYK